MNTLINLLWAVAGIAIGIIVAILFKRFADWNSRRIEARRMELVRQRIAALRQEQPSPEEFRDTFRERLTVNPIVGAAHGKRIERDWIGQQK